MVLLLATTPAEFDSLIQSVQGQDAWANEVASALTSKHFRRPVVTVTSTTIWVVKWREVDMRIPIILRLQDKHYDPLRQVPTTAILDSLLKAQKADTSHLNLPGGATSILSTWNLTAYEKHHQEIPVPNRGIIALQETGCRVALQTTSVELPEPKTKLSFGGSPHLPTVTDVVPIEHTKEPYQALRCNAQLGPSSYAAYLPSSENPARHTTLAIWQISCGHRSDGQ